MKKWFKRIALLLTMVLLVTGLLACGSDSSQEVFEPSDSQIEEFVDAIPDDDAAYDEAATEITENSEEEETATEEAVSEDEELYLDPDGSYNSKEEVALYLYLYGELPNNYLTKKEAQKLGWSGGSLENYAPGCAIGGSYFGNNEGILPDGSYHECDIDTLGKSKRGAKRIVYSDEGEIYYTEDHYETFTLLYTADGPVEEEIIYGDK